MTASGRNRRSPRGRNIDYPGVENFLALQLGAQRRDASATVGEPLSIVWFCEALSIETGGNQKRADSAANTQPICYTALRNGGQAFRIPTGNYRDLVSGINVRRY